MDNTSSTSNMQTSSANSATSSIRSRNVSSASHRSLRQSQIVDKPDNLGAEGGLEEHQTKSPSSSHEVNDDKAPLSAPLPLNGQHTPTGNSHPAGNQAQASAILPIDNNPQDEFKTPSLLEISKKHFWGSLWNAQLTLGDVSRFFLWFLIYSVIIHIPLLIGKLTPPAGFHWEIATFMLECLVVTSYSLLTIISILRQLCYRIPLFTPIRAFLMLLGWLYALICASAVCSWTETISDAIKKTRYGFIGIMGGWALIHTVWCWCERMFARHEGSQERFVVYAHRCLAKSTLNELTSGGAVHKLTFSEKGARVFCFSCASLFKNLQNTETVNNMLKLRGLLMLDYMNFDAKVLEAEKETRLTRRELHSRVYRVYLDLNSNYSEEVIQCLISADQNHLDRPDERMEPLKPYTWFSKLFI